jgi:two-component system, sensor histidine kinase FlrB
MRNIPSTRQAVPSSAPVVQIPTQLETREQLAEAFLTFTNAARSLEQSYTQLQMEVSHLHQELRSANSELDTSLQENSRVRAYLSHVLESLPCGVLVTNKNNQIQKVNPVARVLLQVSGTVTEGAEWHLPASLLSLFPTDADTETTLEHEWCPTDELNGRVLSVSRTIIEGSTHDTDGTIWILRDITEQKRIAMEREASRRRHALADVAAVLAHEIRNPLASMELFTALLEDATTGLRETRPWINHLQAGLRSLSATVNNVLEFHGNATPQLVSIDLDRVLSDTIDFLKPVARQRGQRIEFHNSVGRVAIQGDANRMRQVFLNLSLNAFRAMLTCGTLKVRLAVHESETGDFVRVDFEDEGRGIPIELQDRIFQPGFSSTPGSPGLGLSVCRQVVLHHGGQIRVDSQLDRGATFTVLVPRMSTHD